MPIFQKNDLKILFIHIPKTGGTYIYENLRHRGFIIDPSTYDRKKPRHRNSIQHQTYNDLNERYNIDSFNIIFSITRNPIDRLISQYNWKKRGRKKNINDWIKQIFNIYISNNSIEDDHIKPQINFVGDKSLVFKYEDGLSNIMNKLFEQIDGIKLDLNVVINKSNQRVGIDDLSPNSIKLIKNFYMEDFHAFNYTVNTTEYSDNK